MHDFLLEAKHLAKRYFVKRGFFGKKHSIWALREASFQLQPQQTLAIVGESGSGKTTLAKLLVRMENPTSGELLFEGQGVTGPLPTDIRLIFQNPYASLNPRWQVGEILEEPLKLHTKLSKFERQVKVQEWLTKVGLSAEYAKRYPHMLSGGQRQRVAIARALIVHPKVVIADEALSALDVSIQTQILELLQKLKDELKVAYIFISHDLSVVRSIADEVLVLYFGKVVERGSVKAIFDHPRHPYTKGLLESTPRFGMGKRIAKAPLKGELPSLLNPPKACPFHTRCPMATQICGVIEPELRMVDGRLTACHHAELV